MKKLLVKSQVAAFTRKDGVMVQSHDSGKQAHPHVVGKAENLQGGDAKSAYGMSFAGKSYHASGKVGNSMHDQTPVRHFRESTPGGEDSGQHLWMDHGGDVHADAKSEVPHLRAEHEAHVKASQAKPKGKAHPGPLPQKHVGLIEDSLTNDEESTDKEMHEHLVANGVHPHHATEALKHRNAFLSSGGDTPDHIKDMAAAPAAASGKQKLMTRKP